MIKQLNQASHEVALQINIEKSTVISTQIIKLSTGKEAMETMDEYIY